MEVTDPTEPLFGKRFEILSISRGASWDANVLVKYDDVVVLRVPLRATSLFALVHHGPQSKLSRAAAEEFLSLVKEYELCHNKRKSRRKRSGNRLTNRGKTKSSTNSKPSSRR